MTAAVQEVYSAAHRRLPSEMFSGRHMQELRLDVPIARPLTCPFCRGRVIDTLAKVITVHTCWRCRECDRTWTLAGGAPREGWR
jgi:hypothetical protein